VCSMARAPTPQEEDRRRVCRERRTLVGERVKHVNRIKRTALRLGGVRLRAAAQGSA
jgi:transposase